MYSKQEYTVKILNFLKILWKRHTFCQKYLWLTAKHTKKKKKSMNNSSLNTRALVEASVCGSWELVQNNLIFIFWVNVSFLCETQKWLGKPSNLLLQMERSHEKNKHLHRTKTHQNMVLTADLRPSPPGSH